MKKVLIVLLGIVLIYIVGFGAIKWIRPECVKYNDYYVWWYRYPSFPARYLCALFKRNTYWHDGKWILDGRNGYGDLVFLKNNRGAVRVSVYQDALIKRVADIKDGTEVSVRFGKYLSCDNDTFEDYFIYYVCDVE